MARVLQSTGAALAGAAAALAIGLGAARAGVVHTTQGDVSGVAAGPVESFKGIPFAAPPVGDLRWRAPEPGPSWAGVRAAAAFGPPCLQPSRIPSGVAASEDCLTLNLWRPATAKSGAKLPVMVWIHGGAFVIGSGSVPIYDGASFARDGVVLVTFNYRLGRLGFFAHPALDAGPGPVANYGLMDQIAALKWVQANIAAFGGDPANVTLFGESAGAISVNYLMTTPPARGLFAKAIAESGFGRQRPKPLARAEADGQAFAQAHGVSGADLAAAAALRALPSELLMGGMVGLADPARPGPILDGRILSQGIAEAFASGAAAHVPYLEGGNSYEASLVPRVADFPDPVIARAGDPAVVKTLYGDKPPPEIARELLTDMLITEPDRALARAMAAQHVPAFVYHFSWVPPSIRAGSFGAPHGAEIAYVFQTLPDHPLHYGQRDIPAATPEDQKIAAAMHAYWVAFAKTGTPGAAGGPAWPRYDAASDELIEFGEDGVQVRQHFEQPRLDLVEAAAARRAGP
jgi:para-nitrobenzyl esterase